MNEYEVLNKELERLHLLLKHIYDNGEGAELILEEINKINSVLIAKVSRTNASKTN